MNRKAYIIYLIIVFLFSLNTIFTPYVFSQEPIASGEIKSEGTAKIESSTGNWMQLKDVYPLLENTKIKTEEGVVFIYLNDGSRIDLSQNTEVSITARKNSYTVEMKSGTLGFTVTPSASIVVVTGDAKVSVTRQISGHNSFVAGPAAPAFNNIQGLVSIIEEGTFVRNITGRFEVTPDGIQARILNSGETILVAQGEFRNPALVNPTRNTRVLQGLITGAFFTAGTITAFDAFRGTGKRVASPSGF